MVRIFDWKVTSGCYFSDHNWIWFMNPRVKQVTVVTNFNNHGEIQSSKSFEGDIESFWKQQRKEMILKARMMVFEAVISSKENAERESWKK